ncbi:scavenger receptor cysteine-rich type 1 protein M160-like [Micropterus dolomieu]|uniref:scavenger receptor cysteine-rich type 1 protein M160-like n=1 Tax=Micropterus dolomieu TaxID=147949 RepID=UPI001E8D6B82|nr:scavenger receptor cysteine-rich type 1 protein M160-like [Micropterus dolomieu]
MDHILVVFMLLWSSGLQREEDHTFKETDDIRLVGGSSRCSGLLQVKRQGVWRQEDDRGWDLKLADEVCRQLDCGSVVRASSSFQKPSWRIKPSCINFKSRPRKCLTKRSSHLLTSLEISCSDSVRLVNGTSLCSGRLEVKSNQSWSSVCEDDFNQQDAEVVCRELGCGAPSVLQGTVYRQMRVPVWTKEFQCEGHESALLDCQIDSSGSARDTCSSGKAVELTCSEPNNVRLVGGSTRCAGELEVKHQGRWEEVDDQTSDWNLKTADVVCEQLDCGSAVYTGKIMNNYYKTIWQIRSTCLRSMSAVRECVFTSLDTSLSNLEIKCSGSVRLVNRASPCSGRLEVKSNHLWSSVCEDDFDQQDAEVVCRELGCGAPSVLQGALYGEVEPPVWSKEFQCGGHESALLDCGSSGSARDTCSSGKSVELTCSEPDDVRLVGGASRCVGRLQMKRKGEWRPVADSTFNWDLVSAALVCRQLDCGSALSTERRDDLGNRKAWIIVSACGPSESAIRECAFISHRTHFLSAHSLKVICSGSVRLVNGTSPCSGRLEVESNQLWSSVCEDDFNQQDAEVVCRELGCGAPSVLQGALYGEVEPPVWSKEFQCGGHESALLDCGSSGSARDTCSSGKAVELTCSEPDDVRLVGGASRCVGRLEMKHFGEWRPVADSSSNWDLMSASLVCKQLDCGYPLSTGRREDLHNQDAWIIASYILARPNISFSAYTDGDSEAKQQGLQVLMGSTFTISCSILPQYPGGSFQLIFNNSNTTQNYTLPAVNHSAHFLFSAADHTHQGNYSCVYHFDVFYHNFSSESQPLHLTVSESVRLVNGTSLCSGRLDVKSNQSWSSVCEDDFNQQDAEVVCRELGCGAPSVLQGTVYRQMRVPVWTKEFQCEGHESALLDCQIDSSGSARDTCSSGKAVELTCSEPDDVRLVGGASRCVGRLEMKHFGEWRPVADSSSNWDLMSASLVCRQLDCGYPLSTGRREDLHNQDAWIIAFCIPFYSAIRECPFHSFGYDSNRRVLSLEVTCSDILAQPNIAFTDGDSEAKQQGLQVLKGSNFTISCSILPQYPEGSFQLIFTNSNTTQNYTLPAVNHSAHFLFSAADHTHQGNYSCVYHFYVFYHNFSSESQPLHLTVSASSPDLIIGLVVLVLIVVFSAGLFFYCKARKSQRLGREENTEINEYVLMRSSTED